MNTPSPPSPPTPPPVIITGAGGHCRVLLDTLALLGREVLFLTDADPHKHGQSLAGCEVRGGHDLILDHATETVELVNGVGSVRQPTARRAMYERFVSQGYRFATVCHPRAVVAASARLEAGVQVLAGAIVQPDATVGENTLVNTRASVDHDCRIGPHTHIAPGVTLSGGVIVGAMSHLGAGATVIQGVRIGRGAVIGAGAVVVRDIPDDAVALGVPARATPGSPPR